MGSADALALGATAVAGAVGIVAVVLLWERLRRESTRARRDHPASVPPVSVSLVDDADARRWRIDVRPGAPTTRIDIVSYRPTLPGAAWDSDALAQPIEIGPGSHAILLPAVAPGDGRFDVVVAWTAHHASGDVQGSRSFSVPETAASEDAGIRSTSPARASAAAVLAISVLALVTVVALAAAIDRWSDDATVETPNAGGLPTSTTVSDPPPTQTDTAPTAPATSGAPTPAAASTALPATTVTATSSSTTPSTTPSTMSSTTPSSATSPVPSSSPVIATVTISGRIGPCRYADDCLIAGFEIDGFDPRPQEYVCEFEDGSRFTFRFDSGGVVDACASAAAEATITIDVDGVRSRTITRADV